MAIPWYKRYAIFIAFQHSQNAGRADKDGTPSRLSYMILAIDLSNDVKLQNPRRYSTIIRLSLNLEHHQMENMFCWNTSNLVSSRMPMSYRGIQ
jgi:hypothetical protein